MDFPAYVPASVRAQITAMIDGDAWNPEGWAASLASAEQRLSEIERAIEVRTRRGEIEYLGSLRPQRVEAIEHRDMLARFVDCLLRLAHDPRMRDAFELLTREFTDDKQLRGFISSAWAADVDYSRYREKLKRVAGLRDDIAKAAEKLVRLLRKIDDVGFCYWPSEFFSIPELLRTTDNHEMQNHNLHMWRSMRQHVLGDLPMRDIPDAKPAEDAGVPMPTIEIVIVPMGERAEIDPEEKTRNMLRYAWDTAPSLPALLDTVAKAARDFNPGEPGMVGAAVASRKQNVKAEYVRAFWYQLSDVYKFSMTPTVMRAMAIVANVVINSKDVDVTYDDVRHALP